MKKYQHIPAVSTWQLTDPRTERKYPFRIAFDFLDIVYYDWALNLTCYFIVRKELW